MPISSIDALAQLRFDEQGLIPAVVQDVRTRQLLTLAYMNKESLRKTLETEETWFWSRSRNALWHKGETSGHTQRVERITLDCDGDALLIEVTPRGPACHTGAESCFSAELSGKADPEPAPGHRSTDPGSTHLGQVLGELAAVIARRRRDLPEDSYTATLFKKGLDHIARKVAEESAETLLAAKAHSKSQIAYETADLLYHLLVLLAEEDVALDDVALELAGRLGKKKSEYRS
ncbi:MAG: bifunctional phosphoribosyl-AMP cyclohydrolase/phosphoribosyl-ATP diphosphatase HisIE [Acidobacteriia bacterium]|nr:bifunctional phosphoribosyl-AMP cyclohydrolase/phosphoribosyl-ATP diphosphatase HisIE [Terriglobia bacterium]